MQGTYVTTQEHGLPYAILQPGYHPPRTSLSILGVLADDNTLPDILAAAATSDIVAIDLETCGTTLYGDSSWVVGIGLAWETGNAYFDLLSLSSSSIEFLQTWIADPARNFIAHNAYFDAGFLWRDLDGRHPHFVACTYGLLYQLANEQFDGQSWGLKDAQKTLLGWAETNETELDTWLVGNGYFKNISKEPRTGHYPVTNPETGSVRYLSPNKVEMWRAPSPILGKYCILDAESTYLLYTQVLLPELLKFPALVTYHTDDFLPLVRILIEQHYLGMRVDREQLLRHSAALQQQMAVVEEQFRTHPEVAHHISTYESEKVADYIGREPKKYKKLPKMGEEPNKFRRDGTISKVWEQYTERANRTPDISGLWKKWDAKRRAALASVPKECRFNVNSDPQVRWLVYDMLGYPPQVYTDSGLPSTDETAVRQMGEVGKVLSKYALLEKEFTYIASYLELVTENDTLHPSFRVPGTVTGRLSGRTPNIQQMPKTRGTMSAFLPRPGHVWVDCDVQALEQVVLADLSGDKALLDIYGPTAVPNDIYLYVGSQLPGLGETIRAAGYDPSSPTPAGIASAKKLCKTERSIAKTVVLACSYGAGPGKIFKTLTLSGIPITFDQVKEIHATYWDIFEGVRTYQKQLEAAWRRNGGWVYNGVGRPICVAERLLKDIVNRVCQSTGHDILMQYIQILVYLLREAGIPWNPIIIDFHDESLIEVSLEYAERVRDLMQNDAYRILNNVLDWNVKFKGSAVICQSLADAKLED